MNDDELEELRRRRLAELQNQQAQGGDEQAARAEAEAQRQQWEAQKAKVLRTVLEPEARERLTRVRLARPDVAESLESQLVALHQQGRLRGKINDELLKQFLQRVTPKSRDISIERR
jgi:programmed cell death protein 5